MWVSNCLSMKSETDPILKWLWKSQVVKYVSCQQNSDKRTARNPSFSAYIQYCRALVCMKTSLIK